jgi:hypothetical protein
MVLLFFHSCRRRRRQQTVPPRPPGPRLPSFLHLAESTPFSCAGSMLLPPPATIAATIAATTAATTAATIAATIGTIVTAVSSADPPPLPLALRANGPTRSFSFIFILPCTPFFAASPPGSRMHACLRCPCLRARTSAKEMRTETDYCSPPPPPPPPPLLHIKISRLSPRIVLLPARAPRPSRCNCFRARAPTYACNRHRHRRTQLPRSSSSL